MRACFQVLIIPFTFSPELQIAIFQRNDNHNWQFIAGGGENDEEPIEAAKRESFEEAGISQTSTFIALNTISSIPKEFFPSLKNESDIWVITEYCYAVQTKERELILSSEHKTFQWLTYDKAIQYLKYDSNKTALWELRQRILEENITLF
jgi:dihydroneopterin triphosphate diphosphatase